MAGRLFNQSRRDSVCVDGSWIAIYIGGDLVVEDDDEQLWRLVRILDFNFVDDE